MKGMSKAALYRFNLQEIREQNQDETPKSKGESQ